MTVVLVKGLVWRLVPALLLTLFRCAVLYHQSE